MSSDGQRQIPRLRGRGAVFAVLSRVRWNRSERQSFYQVREMG